MAQQLLTYRGLQAQINDLFVHEVRNEEIGLSFYFSESLSNNDELKNLLYTQGFEIEDFYYETCYYAISEIDDYLNTYNLSLPVEERELRRIFESVSNEIQPDVYTSDLLKWLDGNRLHYVDEHLKTADGLFWALSWGQLDHKREIYEIVFKLISKIGGFI